MAATLADIRIDKLWLNHYLKNYQEFLGPLRNEPVKLLELGIAKGDSLRHWSDWFPCATIAGLDIKPFQIESGYDRVHCYQGEQQDTRILDKIGNELAPEGFDIIIDDASHVGQLSRISFWHLFEHHLKPGGLYFIEDWGTGYWKDYPDGKHYTPPGVQFAWHERILNSLAKNNWIQNKRLLRKLVGYTRWNYVKSRFPSHNRGMVGFVKELVDECGIADATSPEFGCGQPRASRFEWVRFSHGHVIVKKPLLSETPTEPGREIYSGKFQLDQRF
ncbi:hypothetical protein KIH39_03965 [Telmatocola sphagniphila]|uniref:Class I SAM-dependent methyltransferase n=1 Tax=Telmatocola sphagniphila TaxID=1123043 RepID=A0A8E6B8H9_9BACT|nr:hypothetical protein [Telmatocola sphagniphila]QVL33081.1 hypothetical protein KIH39_03965 [Telmatocola sphagniphila]